MAGLIIIPSSTGAFTSNVYNLEQNDLPAQLIKTGLATTETMKVQGTIDGTTFFDLVDENGTVQFAATGRNIIPINIPLRFRVLRGASAAASSLILSFGKAV